MLTEKQRAQAAIRQRRFRKRQQDARRREQRQKGLPAMPSITTMPGKARWQATLEAAEALLNQAVQEMSEYREDRSDAWKESYAADEYLQREKALGKITEKLEEILTLW